VRHISINRFAPLTCGARASFSARVVVPEPEDANYQEEDSDAEEAEESFEPNEEGGFLEEFPDDTQVSSIFGSFVDQSPL
jgi:hypothetical protein